MYILYKIIANTAQYRATVASRAVYLECDSEIQRRGKIASKTPRPVTLTQSQGAYSNTLPKPEGKLQKVL